MGRLFSKFINDDRSLKEVLKPSKLIRLFKCHLFYRLSIGFSPDGWQKNKDIFKTVMRNMDDNASIVKINHSTTSCNLCKIMSTTCKGIA